MKFYNQKILPLLLDSAMSKKKIEVYRPGVVKHAEKTVLEIGFGSGLNIPYYKNITKLIALEPSEEIYNLAKERVAQASFPIEYLKASAEKIPLADTSVDTVVSTWTMCSIPDPEIALREIRRVLKPEGKFVFIEHGKSAEKPMAFFQKICTPFSKNFTGGCHLDRNIEDLILNNGFELIELEKFTIKPKILLMYMYKGVAKTK